jgi:hypothetical protein
MLTTPKTIEILLSEDAIQIVVRKELSRTRKAGERRKKVSRSCNWRVITDVNAMLVIQNSFVIADND